MYAQSSIIQGTILDKTNEPLVGAAIKVVGMGLGTVTDYNGDFEFSVDQDFPVEIEVKYLGYTDKVISITDTNKSVIFLEQDSKQLDEIVVSASKFAQKQEELSVSVLKVSPKAIESQASADLKKTLDQAPGVTAYSNQVNIRNSNGFMYGVGTKVIMLLDDLPLITGDLSSIDLDFLPMQDIQGLEILKGASSVLYGAGALGGVIHLRTARPTNKPKTGVRIRHEVFGKPKNELTAWDAFQAQSTSAHLYHSRRIGNLELKAQAEVITEDGYRESETNDNLRGMLSLYYFPKKLPRLRFGFASGYSNTEVNNFTTWEGYPEGALRAGNIGVVSQEFSKFFIDPRISFFTKKGNKHLLLGRNFVFDRQTNLGFSKSFTSFNEYQYSHSIGENGSIVSGLNYTYSNINAELFGDHSMNSYAAFSQINWSFDRLKVDAGFRYLYDVLDGEKILNQPVFRAGLNYRIGQATYFRSSIGQGVRNPSIAERFVSLQVGSLILTPNPDLEVEKGYSAEIGFRQLLKFGSTEGFFDASVFQMSFDNMIEFGISDPNSLDVINLTSEYAAFNLSDARVRGIELITGAQFKINKWNSQFQIGYTFTDPVDLNGLEELDGVSNFYPAILQDVDITDVVPNELGELELTIENEVIKDQPRTLKYRNKHLLRGGITFENPDWSFSANYRYSSSVLNFDKILFYDPDDIVPAVNDAVKELLPNINDEQAQLLTDAYLADSAVLTPGLREFYEANRKGAHFVDLIAGYTFGKSTVSFHVFNLLNSEYMPISGFLMPHRSFALQYSLSL